MGEVPGRSLCPGAVFEKCAATRVFCPWAWDCSTQRVPGKGKKGKGRAKSHGKKSKKPKPEVDILSPAAMLNLYYIAHNVADCLYLRGFPWPGAPKGKKGKSKT